MPVPQAPAGRAFQDSELDPFTLDLVAAAPVLPAEPAPVPVAAPAVPTSRRGERPESSGRRVLVAVGAACLTGLAGLLAVAAGNRPKKAAPLAASVAPAARPQPIPFTRPVRAPEVYKDAAAW
ncbi:MAG TPA: hypothetical protein VHN99_08390 [Deinococcales bacterium]|nr:hypothetical protein [Deinococcales bacterium]